MLHKKCAQLCFNEAKQEIVIAFIHKVMHAITQSTGRILKV